MKDVLPQHHHRLNPQGKRKITLFIALQQLIPRSRFMDEGVEHDDKYRMVVGQQTLLSCVLTCRLRRL